MQYPEWIWHNGAIKPWAEATTHVMSHALHYGSSVFEGIRSYDTPNGPGDLPPDRPQPPPVRLGQDLRHGDSVLAGTDQRRLAATCSRPTATRTDYLRPIAFRGLGGFGLSADTPTDVSVATWKMGQYLGAGVLDEGIDACVSSWQRFAPNTIPAGAKAGGNYLQRTAGRARGAAARLRRRHRARLDRPAQRRRRREPVPGLRRRPAHDADQRGAAERHHPQHASSRWRATPASQVVERDLPREYLYLCDELFMCGTAAEITPIRSVDGRQVGSGKPGPVTKQMQDLFFGLFDGKTPDKYGWLEPVSA